MKDFDIVDSLRSAGALKAIEMQSSVPGIGPIRTKFVPSVTQLGHNIKPLHWQKTTKEEDWLTRKRDSLMVVASLIATMAFQAGLNPQLALKLIITQQYQHHHTWLGHQYWPTTTLVIILSILLITRQVSYHR
ncbi:hypothetical protein Q3G72_019781 [Acer saccharum]|nr:hypothetical protein Q3G72_019781 [Acer saccharum]